MIKDRVKLILSKKGMTQKQLANQLGITPEALNRTISNNPTVKTLIDIARALETEASELIGSKDVYGFVEVNGNVHKITSIKDLENVLKLAKQSI